jgi:hypothetical protein
MERIGADEIHAIANKASKNQEQRGQYQARSYESSAEAKAED